jgi:hypothetical protein
VRSRTAAKPATTPIPAHLSATEFSAFFFPHLARPQRGPQGTWGSHRVFPRIVWGLYTGMQWKCLPVPKDTNGTPAMHDATVSKVFATWADDGSLWQACSASVQHLAAEQHLDIRMLHGDGTNPVAQKGGMAVGTRGTNTRRAQKSSRSRTIMALSSLPSPWLPSMQRIWGSFLRVCKR